LPKPVLFNLLIYKAG